jgi:hypothetical protein
LKLNIKGTAQNIPSMNAEKAVKNTGTSEKVRKPKLMSHLFPRLKAIKKINAPNTMINSIKRQGMATSL